MKSNSKGFTLIELLAVIVILAIIALIATPIILGIINDAKKGASQNSAYGYIHAVETAIAVEMTKDTTFSPGTAIDTVGKIGSGDTAVNVSYKGTAPTKINLSVTGYAVTGGYIEVDGYAWAVDANGKLTATEVSA